MMGLPGRESSLTISLAVWKQYMTWQTDKHRSTASTAFTHSAAW